MRIYLTHFSEVRVEVLRLYDPDRRPPSWAEIIRPGQFAAFSKLADSGASCDADGRSFVSDSEITCLLFDSLTEARQFCSEQVLRIPGIRFDVFDSSGRTKAPLLVMVHPSREHTLPDSQRGVRARRWLALGLTIVGVPLIWLDYQAGEAALGFAFLGITLIVGAMRVLFLDMATRENERNRQARLARYEQTMPEGASDAAGTRKE